MSLRSLTDEVLVDAFYGDFGVVRDGDFDFGRDVEQNRMGFTEVEVQLFTLDGSLETDALNLEVLTESLSPRRGSCWPGESQTDRAEHGA